MISFPTRTIVDAGVFMPKNNGWNIELYPLGSNKSPITDFLDNLPLSTLAKVRHVMRLLQEFGPQLRQPYSKKLTGCSKLFELRTSGNSPVRLLYTISGRTFIILNGFVKKTNKTPSKEIKTALSRMAILT